MENITVRKMQKEDVGAISAIYGGITQKTVHPDFNGLIEQHAQRDEDICLVAELDGQIVGFMIIYILTLGFGIEKSAWIATLGVKPEYMGQDIGKNMADKIFEYYKSEGIESVFTSVRWNSSDLLSFFKTLGLFPSPLMTMQSR